MLFELKPLAEVYFNLLPVGGFGKRIFIGRRCAFRRAFTALAFGFFILYAAQVVFILWGERMVGVLSLLQALLALCSNADYTFSLLVRFVGRMYYTSHVLTVQEISVYKYVFVSACFTLELFKTYLMFALLPAPQKATADLKTTQP